MRDFRDVERLFSELLAGSASLLTSAEQDAIQNYIDNREYGLALETLVDIFVEEAKAPTEIVLSTVVALSNRMAIDPESFLERLRQLK
jgi:hypothetical protein